MKFYPHVGITSRLSIDSDCAIRSGEEKHWKHTHDDWVFNHYTKTI